MAIFVLFQFFELSGPFLKPTGDLRKFQSDFIVILHVGFTHFSFEESACFCVSKSSIGFSAFLLILDYLSTIFSFIC